MKTSPQQVAHDTVTQTLMSDLERYWIFFLQECQLILHANQSPHFGWSLQRAWCWDRMGPVPHKPNSNRMLASPLHEAVTQACSENFQQLHLHRHWFSLLCTNYLLQFILSIYICYHQLQHTKTCLPSLGTMTLREIAWGGFRAWLSHYFMCLHFAFPNQTVNSLREETWKLTIIPYIDRRTESNNNKNDIWTKRPLLLLVIEKICLNMFRRL